MLFSEMVDDYLNVPTPRPTLAHTYDFGCTFMGAWLLDGECKATTSKSDIGFMVLHCYVFRQVGKVDHYRDRHLLQKLPTHVEEIPVAEVEG